MATTGATGEALMRRSARARHAESRIYYAADRPPSVAARWTSRLAIFAAATLGVTLFLHRLLSLPTPVAISIAWGVFIAAGVALTLAAVAGLDIWFTGRQGAARVLAGATVSLGLLAIPASLWLMSFSWPDINDVTTDTAEPPEFTEAKNLRGPAANSIDYPGEAFAHLQQQGYPDLKSLVIPKTSEEAYELVLQALAKLKLKTTLELPPEEDEGSAGFIELSDKSMILGVVDDVVIRVLPEDKTARIDVRSASRYGATDFGRNAERVRSILREIVGRLEASVPDPEKALRAKERQEAKEKVKGQKARGQGSAADRRRPNLSRSSIRHAPEQKASPPAASAGRGPGKPAGQFDE
jgi:hypothetical protein